MGWVNTSEAIAYFDGSRAKLADALGIEPPSIYSWGENPPPLRQIQLEQITVGKLKAEPNCFEAHKFRKTAV